jgi:hypothetical protein
MSCINAVAAKYPVKYQEDAQRKRVLRRQVEDVILGTYGNGYPHNDIDDSHCHSNVLHDNFVGGHFVLVGVRSHIKFRV